MCELSGGGTDEEIMKGAVQDREADGTGLMEWLIQRLIEDRAVNQGYSS